MMWRSTWRAWCLRAWCRPAWCRPRARRRVRALESDITLRGVPGAACRAVFIRAPWVERIGRDVEVLATEPTTGKIVAVRQGQALATAFHPELTQDNRVHKIFIDMVRERS